MNLGNLRMVSLLLTQDEYLDLLGALPDEYFRLTETAKEQIWQRILHGVNRGERDIEKLIELADLPSTISLNPTT